jgi:hypothetical protein
MTDDLRSTSPTAIIHQRRMLCPATQQPLLSHRSIESNKFTERPGIEQQDSQRNANHKTTSKSQNDTTMSSPRPPFRDSSPAASSQKRSRFTYRHLSQMASYSTSCPLRVIAHIDLDCFYAQAEMVRLGVPEDQPLAVQQWKVRQKMMMDMDKAVREAQAQAYT